MGDELEGPAAAPLIVETPYTERPKPARKATAHLKNRTLHPRNRQVVTPAGIFASASQAAEAHGYSRGHGSHLAKNGLRGWRWFIHGVDEGKVKPIRGISKRPPLPYSKRVITPEGVYASATEAGRAFGISRQAASRRALLGLGDWRYLEPR